MKPDLVSFVKRWCHDHDKTAPADRTKGGMCWRCEEVLVDLKATLAGRTPPQKYSGVCQDCDAAIMTGYKCFVCFGTDQKRQSVKRDLRKPV